MATYVLRWVGQGQNVPKPGEPTHYLYRSVRRDPRHGWLLWRITPDTDQARTWATREGAEGYATRLHGHFVVDTLAD